MELSDGQRNLLLRDYLKWIDQEKLVIPNFQREYVWTDEDVKTLITSLIFKVKIGALLLYEQTDERNKNELKENFLPYLTFKDNETIIDSPKDDQPLSTLKYVIDGQQRLTSSLIAFSSYHLRKGIKENFSRKYKRQYFLRIPKDTSLFGINDENIEFKEPEIGAEVDYDVFAENYIISKPHSDDSQPNDDENYYIPLDILYKGNTKKEEENIYSEVKSVAAQLEKDKIRNSDRGRKSVKQISDDVDNWAMKMTMFLRELREQPIPYIPVQDNLKEAIKTYEILNTSGRQLSDLDILSAEYSKVKKDARLYDIINNRFQSVMTPTDFVDKHNLINQTKKHSPLETDKDLQWNFRDYMVQSQDKPIPKKVLEQFMKLLKYCEIIDSFGNGINDKYKNDTYKSDSLLKLKATTIEKYKNIAIDAISWASMFMQLRCGLKHINDLTNYWKLFVVAALKCEFDDLDKNGKFLNILEGWYFLSRFLGRYRIDQNVTALNDLQALTRYFNNEDNTLYIFKEQLENLKLRYIDEYQHYDIEAKDLKRELLLLESEVAEPFKKLSDFICEFGVRKGYTTTKLNDDEEFISTLSYPFHHFDNRYKLEKHHLYALDNAKKSASESTSRIRNEDTNVLNSPLNYAYMTSGENKYISNRELEKYYHDLEISFRKRNVIPSDADNIETFLEKRYKELFENIYEEISNLFNT